MNLKIDQSISWLISESLSQSISQSGNQSIYHPINQSVYQIISQSFNESVSQSNKQATNQPIGWYFNQRRSIITEAKQHIILLQTGFWCRFFLFQARFPWVPSHHILIAFCFSVEIFIFKIACIFNYKLQKTENVSFVKFIFLMVSK